MGFEGDSMGYEISPDFPARLNTRSPVAAQDCSTAEVQVSGLRKSITSEKSVSKTDCLLALLPSDLLKTLRQDLVYDRDHSGEYG